MIRSPPHAIMQLHPQSEGISWRLALIPGDKEVPGGTPILGLHTPDHVKWVIGSVLHQLVIKISVC